MRLVSRFILALFFLYIYTESRAQIRIPDRLSPASCLKKQEALCKSLAKNEVWVIYSGETPLRRGNLPATFSADPLFQYLTGLNTPGAVLVLSGKPLSFEKLQGQRLLFTHQGTYDPSLPVQTEDGTSNSYTSALSISKIDRWDEFAGAVLTADSIKRIFLWEPSTHTFLGEGAEMPIPILDLFRLAGPGEPYYSWSQGLLDQILTATESNYQQVLRNVRSMVQYRPIAKELGFVQEALRVADYNGMTELQNSLSQAKISLVVDGYAVLEKIKGASVAEENAIAQKLASAMKSAFQFGLKQVKPGCTDAELSAAATYKLIAGGCDQGSLTKVWSGANAGYFTRSENRSMNAADVVMIEAQASAGCFSLTAGRTFRVNGAFESKQNAVMEWALTQHRALLKTARADFLAGKYAVPATKESFIEFLKGSGLKLNRSQEASPVFAQSFHVLGPVETYAIRPLWVGAWVEATTEIRFPASAGYSDGLNGFGIVLKDVLLITDEGITNLTAGIPLDPSGLAAWQGSSE